jgi:hypothetical protein
VVEKVDEGCRDDDTGTARREMKRVSSLRGRRKRGKITSAEEAERDVQVLSGEEDAGENLFRHEAGGKKREEDANHRRDEDDEESDDV